MTKAVIFDFDGVICDSFEIAYGVAHEIFDKISRDGYRDFFMGNVYDKEEVTESEIKKFFSLQCKRFEGVRMNDDVIRGLHSLKENHSLYIVSSNMEETIDEVLKNSNSSKTFSERLGFESGRSKVKKFEYLLQKYNLKKEECVFVTDTLGDILEANEIGVASIAVDFGFHDVARLEKGKPLLIASSFDEVVNYINK